MYNCEHCEDLGYTADIINTVHTGRGEGPIYREVECEFCYGVENGSLY
jgi:hypothetical protein